MNKLRMVFLTATLLGASAGIAMADDTQCHGMSMNMKTMDTNGDGMISKDEFMKFHEMMWDKMKKDANGMVSVKEMQMHHQAMKHCKMMKENKSNDMMSSPK